MIINDVIAVDIGVSFKSLKDVYKQLQIVLLTHEHTDHINKTTIKRLAKERPTLRFGCCEWLVPILIDCNVSERNIDVFEIGKVYDYGVFKVSPIKLYHNVQNCGYRLFIGTEKAIYATDTEHLEGITAKDYDLYMIEANYSDDELQERIDAKMKAGEYCYELNVASRHLSHEQASEWLLDNMRIDSQYVFLHQHQSKKIQVETDWGIVMNDLVGQKFGRLTVIKKTNDYVSPKGRHQIQWLCKCDCGNKKIIIGNSLRKGVTRSCGCLTKEVASSRKGKGLTHGKRYTRLYRIWETIKTRCYNKNANNYERYGGRGITVCNEWLHDFQAFYDWAMANGYADNLTIDRIDNDKGYSPDNCRWATVKEQSYNRRSNKVFTYNGKTQTLKQWADEFCINRCTLSWRLNHNWTFEEAITVPIHKRRCADT